MAKTKSADASQTIEQLQARYQELAKQKIVVETDRKHALEKLESLKASALEKYGSDDLEDLQRMLKKMKSDNESMRVEYQKDLDRIEKQLCEIEAEFNPTDE